VGDGKMACRETRASIAAHGDSSLCPLPQVHLGDGELDAALAALGRGEPTLTPVYREPAEGDPELSAEGFARQVPMGVEVAGTTQPWTERRVMGRSMRQARAAEAALRRRVGQAQVQVEALNQRGRGRERFADVPAIRHAVHDIGQRYGVEDFLWFRLHQETNSRPVRASQERAARVDEERHATVEVRVDTEALAAAVHRLGWRVYGTNQPREQLSLAHAVLAYRSMYQVERRFGRLTGRPLSLQPMDGQRDDHATGLIRVLSLGLRVLTRLECVVRRHLAAAGAQLAGLYAGHAKRATARPTAERLLEALQDMPLTRIERPQQTERHLPALSPLQQRILELLGFPSDLYTRLCIVSAAPP
jgi:transposase